MSSCSYVILGIYILYIGRQIQGYSDTRGTEFLIGFLENRAFFDQPVVYIYVTSACPSPVNVTVQVPKMASLFPAREFNLDPYTSAITDYPYRMHMQSHNTEYKGIYVTSTGLITVQCASVNDLSSDAFLPLPVRALGCEHYVMTYVYGDSPLPHEQGPALIGLVAAYNDTVVNIYQPNHANISVTLDQFETYQHETYEDITGAYVQSDMPLAVLSGAEWTSVAGFLMGDHLAEQLVPTHAWGSHFIAVPFAARNGDLFRILAKNYTEIEISWDAGYDLHSDQITLSEGEYYEFAGPDQKPLMVVSSQEVLLGQYLRSYSDASVPRGSDPMLVIIPPITQFLDFYSFQTIDSFSPSTPFQHYVGVVVKKAHRGGLRLDGSKITELSDAHVWNDIGGTDYMALVIQVSAGAHVFKHQRENKTFGAVLYGVKFQEAYGFSLGHKTVLLDKPCSDKHRLFLYEPLDTTLVDTTSVETTTLELTTEIAYTTQPSQHIISTVSIPKTTYLTTESATTVVTAESDIGMNGVTDRTVEIPSTGSQDGLGDVTTAMGIVSTDLPLNLSTVTLDITEISNTTAISNTMTTRVSDILGRSDVWHNGSIESTSAYPGENYTHPCPFNIISGDCTSGNNSSFPEGGNGEASGGGTNQTGSANGTSTNPDDGGSNSTTSGGSDDGNGWGNSTDGTNGSSGAGSGMDQGNTTNGRAIGEGWINSTYINTTMECSYQNDTLTCIPLVVNVSSGGSNGTGDLGSGDQGGDNSTEGTGGTGGDGTGGTGGDGAGGTGGDGTDGTGGDGTGGTGEDGTSETGGDGADGTDGEGTGGGSGDGTGGTGGDSGGGTGETGETGDGTDGTGGNSTSGTDRGNGTGVGTGSNDSGVGDPSPWPGSGSIPLDMWLGGLFAQLSNWTKSIWEEGCNETREQCLQDRLWLVWHGHSCETHQNTSVPCTDTEPFILWMSTTLLQLLAQAGSELTPCIPGSIDCSDRQYLEYMVMILSVQFERVSNDVLELLQFLSTPSDYHNSSYSETVATSGHIFPFANWTLRVTPQDNITLLLGHAQGSLNMAWYLVSDEDFSIVWTDGIVSQNETMPDAVTTTRNLTDILEDLEDGWQELEDVAGDVSEALQNSPGNSTTIGGELDDIIGDVLDDVATTTSASTTGNSHTTSREQSTADTTTDQGYILSTLMLGDRTPASFTTQENNSGVSMNTFTHSFGLGDNVTDASYTVDVKLTTDGTATMTNSPSTPGPSTLSPTFHQPDTPSTPIIGAVTSESSNRTLIYILIIILVLLFLVVVVLAYILIKKKKTRVVHPAASTPVLRSRRPRGSYISAHVTRCQSIDLRPYSALTSSSTSTDSDPMGWSYGGVSLPLSLSGIPMSCRSLTLTESMVSNPLQGNPDLTISVPIDKLGKIRCKP